VSGGDVATPNLFLGGNSVEAIIIDWLGRRFEVEGSNNKLVVGLQRAFKSLAVRPAIY
jgi:hypothetical protein